MVGGGRGRRLGASPGFGTISRSGAAPSSPRRINNRSANWALISLLVMAFLFSGATIFIMSPTITRSILALDNDSSMYMNMDMGGENAMGMRSGESDMSIEQLSATTTSPPPSPSLPSAPPRKTTSTSDLITWILSGRDKDAKTHHNARTTLHNSPPVILEFLPGTLSLTHAQTLQNCWAVPQIYGKHVQGNRNDGSRVPVSYSTKHKLAYVMLPKSGSSTARHMLKNEFDAKEGQMSLQPASFVKGGKMEGIEVISFVRDPLSRFFSQYDEAYVRAAPWAKGSNPYYINPETKSQSTPHPFPYLYENIHSYHDYEDVFCPISTRKSRSDCILRKSAENGTLASRFERFVREYDGQDPFDIHLTLQVPMMSSKDGLPLHMTQIYNTTDSEGGWNQIAKQFLGEHVTLGEEGQNSKGVIAGRSYPRRFNSELVSIETQRRICELTLLDYCCLNLPLPDVCKGKHYFNEATGGKRELFCALDPGGRIQPGIFPEKNRN